MKRFMYLLIVVILIMLQKGDGQDVLAGTNTLRLSSTKSNDAKVVTSQVRKISTFRQLKEALTSSGGSYKLIAHISGADAGISITKGIHKLDLNGYTIQGKNSKSSLLLVNGGNLTIYDSGKKGMIKNTKNQDAVGCASGKLMINGGTYYGVYFAVYIEGGTVTINQGVFKGKQEGIRLTKGTLTVNGGKILALNDSFSAYGIFITGNNKTKTVINGGTIDGNTAVFVNSDENCALTIKSGTFTGKYEALSVHGGTMTIRGGKITAKVGAGIGLVAMYSEINCSISGGEIHSATNAVEIQNRANLFVTGGKFIVSDTEKYVQLYIYETHQGEKKIADGVISAITDETPKGRGLIATEFKNNGAKYVKGMTIKDTDTLYSVAMDIAAGLHQSYSFECSKDIYDVFAFYYDKWMDGISKDSNISGGQTSFGGDTYRVNGKQTYQLGYEIYRLSKNTKLSTNASDDAKNYNKQLDTIIAAVIKPGMTDIQKVTAIHDYMKKEYSYDYSFLSDSFEFYGLLKNKKGVCQAYAGLFELLMTKLDIKAGFVTGMAGEPNRSGWEYHMWNFVELNGERLYVDVTFDDGLGSNKFLLKTKEEFYGYGYHD